MLEIIKKSEIFNQLNDEAIKIVLKHLNSYTKDYQKEELIYAQADVTSCLGILIEGSATIEINDIWGNTNIVTRLAPSDSFAETYAFLGDEKMIVDVRALEKTKVLFLNVQTLLNTTNQTCQFHDVVVNNLALLMAHKNIVMMRKIEHLSAHSTKEKVLSYLFFESVKQGSYRFKIPFNRQMLADYLNVDRSSLSNELSKMQKEGILTFNKNYFILKKEN